MNGWLEQLRCDKTLIVQAAAQAQKAADFTLGPVGRIIACRSWSGPDISSLWASQRRMGLAILVAGGICGMKWPHDLGADLWQIH
jgi:hypothetical protein